MSQILLESKDTIDNQYDDFSSTPIKSNPNKDIPSCPNAPRKITVINDGFSTPTKSKFTKSLSSCPNAPRKITSNDY